MTKPAALSDRRSLPVQLSDELQTWITSGEFAVGARLPTESAVAVVYCVSLVTAREALRPLQRDGLVTARPGRGHFARG